MMDDGVTVLFRLLGFVDIIVAVWVLSTLYYE